MLHYKPGATRAPQDAALQTGGHKGPTGCCTMNWGPLPLHYHNGMAAWGMGPMPWVANTTPQASVGTQH